MSTGELRLPQDWLRDPAYAGVTIIDCDGWTAAEWAQPCSRAEFSARLGECTTRQPPYPLPPRRSALPDDQLARTLRASARRHALAMLQERYRPGHG